MTTPGPIYTLARSHVRITMIALGVVMLMAAGLLIYRAGKHAQAVADEVAQMETNRTAARAATAEALRAKAFIKAANDSLRTRGDSLNRLANERHTAANVVRNRLSIHGDTAIVKTDSGPERISIPPLLANQLAAERMSTDSAFAAMDHRHENDSALVAGLTTQIQLDSVVENRYRAELSAAQAEIDLLKKQSAPRFTFGEGAVLGTVVTVAARIVVAFLTHR